MVYFGVNDDKSNITDLKPDNSRDLEKNDPTDTNEDEKKKKEGGLTGTQTKEEKEEFMNSLILNESINKGISLVPESIMQNLVKNFDFSKKTYGEGFLRALTGYDDNALKQNINLVEFQNILEKKIKNKIKELKEKTNNFEEEKVIETSKTLFLSEINKLKVDGFLGTKKGETISHYGEESDTREFRQGDNFKDIDIKKTIKKTILNKHDKIKKSDLVSKINTSNQRVELIIFLDCSGSMQGEKIFSAKKSATFLAYKASVDKQKVGMVCFRDKILLAIEPTNNFNQLIESIIPIRASGKTDIPLALKKGIEIISKEKSKKHFIIISDALDTDKVNDIINTANMARNKNISISVIGINLEPLGKQIAQKISQITSGHFYELKSVSNMTTYLLEDYVNYTLY